MRGVPPDRSSPGHDAARTVILVAALTATASVIGSAVVALLLGVLVPLPSTETLGARATVLLTAAGYLVVAVAIGVLYGAARSRRSLQWLAEGREPTADEARRALNLPDDAAALSAGLWLVGAVVIGLVSLALTTDHRIALRISLTIVLGGLVTAGVSYLLAGRASLPVASRALVAYPPRRRTGAGVTQRLVLSWLLASGVPTLGLLLLDVDPSNPHGATRGATTLLCSISLLVGALAMVLASRAVGRPLRAVRRTVERVATGEYTVRVPVDDAGEIGLLQNGVNLMAAGLAERETLRDLFGKHVGVEVARRALHTGVALGGEHRRVAVLFVDITGSTTLAIDRGAAETVAVLNRFFQIVVDAVESGGGLLNKFQGDAALCVFGAPTELPDAATVALQAARRIVAEVGAAGEVGIGVGVSFGDVVAGQIGATSRLEYTVIGDAVNEAARLTELAKHDPGAVLASGEVVTAATAAERGHWRLHDRAVLRGRSAATVIHRLADVA